MSESDTAARDLLGKPWGSFPVERYLLENWKTTTNEDTPDQYRRLVRAFLKSGDLINMTGSDYPIEPEGVSPPTEEQIAAVLKPWRSEKLRQIAGSLKNERDDEIVILRTHYGQDAADDETMARIREVNEEEDINFKEQHAWWQFLDDRNHFAFGDDWEKVFDVLPELTLRGVGKPSCLDPAFMDEAANEALDYGRDLQEYVQAQAIVSSHPIALVDKETFSTSKLKLIFYDANGNVVRSTRVETPCLGMYRMHAFRGTVDGMDEWNEAEVGQSYQADGTVGRVLYERAEASRER